MIFVIIGFLIIGIGCEMYIRFVEFSKTNHKDNYNK